ncbi:DUF342 domain-containing protein [Leptospira sp. GIMC2001]|uniref:DUF342 domain-containing protein n=1 Tax=Leptospira sp. GIMC2001 TaxID=1513297 RepID=UPI00234973EF|nr:FapA family protein [Leptospira sp. GIMC2001]WCL50503.1 FapA family protein [Leptospira sp. GIMC2001]
MSDTFTAKVLKDLEDMENGFFHIANQHGKAILKVTPGGKLGSSVEPIQVITRVKIFGVEGFDEREIRRIVKEADGKEHIIGKWTGGEPEDSRAEITTTEDRMEANIVINPPKHGGKSLDESAIRTALDQSGIKFGIIEEIIKELALDPEYFVQYTIAEGTRPLSGGDGGIEMVFDTSDNPNLKENEKGQMDFREIGIIKSIPAGQILAKKIDPKPGKNGMNVYGDPIPFEPGKEMEWKLGSNVKLSDDKKSVIAMITGRPVMDRSGFIRVDEVVHLENVDFSTGNVDFPGTIIVEEKIADGFSLTTQGSLIIKKSVGKVFLKAKGDVVLSGGFMGRGGGTIQSDGEIYAKFVEQGKMISGKSVYIEEAAMHSEITAELDVVVSGGRGEIIGGDIIAGRSVTCNKLGAVVETKTTLTVGTPPDFIEELEKMRADINSRKEVLLKVEQTMNRMVEDASKRDLTQEEQNMLIKLKEVESKYKGLLNTSMTQFNSAVNSYEPTKDSFVLVEREIHPGVEINLGKGKYYKVGLNSIVGKSRISLGVDGNVHNERSQLKRR